MRKDALRIIAGLLYVISWLALTPARLGAG